MNINERTLSLVEHLTQDGSDEVYQCSPEWCGYEGDTYCQNCGYGPLDSTPDN